MIDINNVKKVKNYLRKMIPYQEALLLTGEDKRYIVQNKNQNVVIFSVYRLHIIDYRLRDEILAERVNYITQLFSSYFDSQYEFTYDYIRTYYDYDLSLPECDPELKNTKDFLELRYKESLEKSYFDNSIYLSICYRPVSEITTKPEKILTDKHIENFKNTLQTLEGSLKLCGFDYKLLCDNSLMTYLYKSTSNNFRFSGSLSLPQETDDICDILSESIDIYPSISPLLIDNKLIQCITINNLPLITSPNMLSAFDTFPFAARLFIKYHCLSDQESRKFIYNKKEKYKATRFRLKSSLAATLRNEKVDEDEIDIASIMGMQGCNNALIHKEDQNLGAGFMSVTILISANQDREDFLIKATNQIITMLSEVHLLGIKETINNTYDYFSTFIGTDICHKKFFLLTDNFSDFLPISFTSQNYYSNFLEKITGSSLPFLTGRTADTKSLYKLSLCGKSGNFGHTFLAAPTGAGKSITLALMANEWLKYKNTQVFYIDMGLSCLRTIRDNNGKLFVPTIDDSAFAPFLNANKDENSKIQTVNFIRAIALANNVELTPKDTKLIVKKIEELDNPNLSFEDFYTSFSAASENNALNDALNIYITVYKDLFNAQEDIFRNIPRIAGIELKGLLSSENNALIYPTLVYIFNQLENIFIPDKPALLILDEAWRFIDNPFFVAYIKNWLKTLRKKNVFVVISTQEINDLISSSISHSILENVYTRIFLRNTRANEPHTKATYEKLGLEDYEINLIATMPPYFQLINQENTIATVTWDIDSEQLKFIETTTEDKKDYDI